MSPKSEKLAQRLQEAHKLVASKLEQNETSQISQELEKIAERLREGKLTIQIVSENLISAQALHDFLNRHQPLLEFYQFEVTRLPNEPKQAKLEASAALIYQIAPTSSTDQRQPRYELLSNQEAVLGRSPKCEICLDSGPHSKVSWHHAKVQSLATTEANPASVAWQICDLNSTNGTYVNGKRLQGCQTLQTGDRIAISSPTTGGARPEFTFEYQPSSPAAEANGYKQVIDCDVLCLIIDGTQPLSTNERWFITIASEAQIAKRVVIVDVPKTASADAESTQSNLVEVETWMQNQAAGSSFELTPLPLYSFYPHAQETEVDPSSQKELERFFKSLEALVKRKPEDILTQRLAGQMLAQLSLVERVFAVEAEALNKQIQQQEAELQELANVDLKEQTKKALRKASDDKDKFFKQVKVELSQSKGALLDPFSKKSIFYQIQLSTDQLRPFVTKREDSKYVQLRSETIAKLGDVNTYMARFCGSTLDKWANQEWERIYAFYTEGGLSGLFRRIYVTLNVIPSLNLENTLSPPSQNINIQKSLMNSFVGVPCESRYKEASPIGYVIKQIRTNMMQVMFMIGLVAMLGGAAVGGKQLLLGILQPLRNTPWLLGMVLFGLICLLTYAYRKDNSLKLEEVGDKLKKELSNHYQSLAKNLAERLVQDFSVVLEAEERRIKESLEIVSEQFMAHIIDVEKSQLLLKSQIDQQKLQQKNLDKEKSEFQKLKRI